MIYVYGLIDSASTSCPTSAGLDDRPLQATTVIAVSAVFTCHQTGAIPPLPQNLWRHEQVVESFMRDSTRALLPARFGTTFPSQAHLEDVLARHQQPLVAGLERVRGCVELGLRVAGGSSAPRHAPLPAPAPSTSGREYMMARLADERRRRESEEFSTRVAAELDQVLAPLAREVVHRASQPPSVIMNAAYLVDYNQSDHFAASVRSLATSHPSLQLLCTGPWPAYHFAPSVPVMEASHG